MRMGATAARTGPMHNGVVTEGTDRRSRSDIEAGKIEVDGLRGGYEGARAS
jgi:hypothetical protein